MYHELAPIISNQELLPGIFLLKLKSVRLAAASKPGQFVMISSDYGQERLLRRPISLFNAIDEELHFLFAVVGGGTEWLSKRKTGERLDILGPAGNGFSIGPDCHKVLMVGGGMGIAPLAFLADQSVKKGQAVRLLAGAKSGSQLLPLKTISSG